MTGETPPRDHAPGMGGDNGDDDNGNGADDTAERRSIEENVKSRSTWERFLFLVLFLFIYAISRFVVGAVVLIQFLCVLITGEPNARLLVFGRSLALYTSQIICFLTYASNDRPFPFDLDWPSGRQGS